MSPRPTVLSRLALPACLLLGSFIPALASAADITVPLGDFKLWDDGWDPFIANDGALIAVSIDHKISHSPGGASLKVTADLTGNTSTYVGISKNFDNLPVRTISGWYRSDGVTGIGWRVIDSTGQCFQTKIPVQDGKTWERLDLAIDDLITSEHWGGKNDGAWHGPLTGISIDPGVDKDKPVGTIWLDGLTAGLTPGSPRPAPHVAPKSAMIEDFEAGTDAWQFLPGQEFPGAAGLVEPSKKAHDGRVAMNLVADFRGGGQYIGAHRKDIPEVPGDVLAVMLWVKADGIDSVNARLIDSDGQVFQGKGFSIMPGKEWQELTMPMKDLVKGEHWGGKNDGVFRAPVTQMTLTVGIKSVPDKQGSILFDNVRFIAIPDKNH